MTEKKNKPPFYLIDTDADFYRPLGVRIAICASVAVWATIEIYNGDGFWGILSGAAAIYCFYVLFLTYNPPPPKPETPVRPPDDDEDEEIDPPPAEKKDDAPQP